MRRTCLVVAALLAAAALVLPLSAEGDQPDGATSRNGVPAASSLAVTHTRTVRLITGDSVRVMTRADGSQASTIVAGPHAGGEVARWRTAGASYLLPRLARSEQPRLDTSLFDVARLASLPGHRVPIVVTLRPHASPSALRGLGSGLGLNRTGTGHLRGSYTSSFRGLDRSELAAVRSIRLAGHQAAPEATGPTHALTVHVSNRRGGPGRDVVLFIENVDNADAYLATPSTDSQGNVTVNVPEGDYGVMAWTFRKLVVAPEAAVTADTTVSLDLGDATVRPHVSLPGYRVAEAVLSVGRDADKGWGFPLEFSGPRFFMHVQPTSGHVAHGRCTPGCRSSWPGSAAAPPSRPRTSR
jgi:hypothetical protein